MLSSATPPKFGDQISPSTSITALANDSVTAKPVTQSSTSMYPSRVILTSEFYPLSLKKNTNLFKNIAYPGQHGIKPISLDWGAKSAKERGPIVASRHAESIKKR